MALSVYGFFFNELCKDCDCVYCVVGKELFSRTMLRSNFHDLPLVNPLCGKLLLDNLG